MSRAIPLLPLWAVRPVKSLYKGALFISNLEFVDTKRRAKKFREFVLHWITCTSSLQKLFPRTVLTWREEADTYYRDPGFHYREIYLLTANGLTPGGSSTVHIYTQTIHRTTQLIWEGREGRAPSLRVIPWHLPCNWGKSTEKPQSG
jgi:hypothetical protein